jgi:hypothetical protein
VLDGDGDGAGVIAAEVAAADGEAIAVGRVDIPVTSTAVADLDRQAFDHIPIEKWRRLPDRSGAQQRLHDLQASRAVVAPGIGADLIA